MVRFIRNLYRAPLVVAAFAVLTAVLIIAVLGPYIAPRDPLEVSVLDRFTPPLWQARGSSQFILGSDSLGRDTFSRLILGTRVSLLVGVVAVVIGGTIGVIAGLLAGYFGSRIDAVIMRLVDIQLAFPGILLALTVLALLGRSMFNLILVLGIVQWAPYARIVRGYVLSVREQEFVAAAYAMGSSWPRIIFQHILPNALAPIIVIASFSVATTILAESTLSFLGLGVPPGIPSWGGMLAEGRDYLVRAWWLATFPGLAITLTVLSINIIGDWFRDYLDPRLRNSL